MRDTVPLPLPHAWPPVGGYNGGLHTAGRARYSARQCVALFDNSLNIRIGRWQTAGAVRPGGFAAKSRDTVRLPAAILRPQGAEVRR